MHYLTELSTEELRRNFELANEFLKEVFSKYPYPGEMEGCPCCIGDDKQKSLNQDNLLVYLRKAMTTWGGENDFKYYIPKLFSIVYLERKCDHTFVFINKLNYVQNFSQNEIQSIVAWFSAYSKYMYIEELKRLIEKSRLSVQDWLGDITQELSCDFPFSIFLKDEFNEMVSFLDAGLIEKFVELLDTWPLNETDFVVYAWCLTNFLIFSDSNYGIFKERAPEWIKKNKNILEKFFWKTKDPRLQQLFSDALPPNFYPTPPSLN